VRSAVWLTIALASLPALGCAGRQAQVRGEGARLRAEVAELRAQHRRDRRIIRDLENQVVVLQDELAVEWESDRALPVEVRGPEPAPPVAAAPAAPGAEGTPPGRSAASLRNRLGDGDVEVVYVGEAAKDEPVRPSIRLHQSTRRDVYQPTAVASPLVLEERLPTERLPTTSGKVLPLSAAGPRKVDDPVVEYKRYYAALRARNHAFAIVGFRHFVDRYPTHEYADNAQYWLGEAYYDQGQFEAALVEFQQVMTAFSDGNKAPAALLKIGYCHERLGDGARAREVLSQVIERFPASQPARLAKDRLAELDAPGD
jgi:tol-pal system protein YbgF